MNVFVLFPLIHTHVHFPYPHFLFAKSTFFKMPRSRELHQHAGIRDHFSSLPSLWNRVITSSLCGNAPIKVSGGRERGRTWKYYWNLLGAAAGGGKAEWVGPRTKGKRKLFGERRLIEKKDFFFRSGKSEFLVHFLGYGRARHFPVYIPYTLTLAITTGSKKGGGGRGNSWSVACHDRSMPALRGKKGKYPTRHPKKKLEAGLQDSTIWPSDSMFKN